MTRSKLTEALRARIRAEAGDRLRLFNPRQQRWGRHFQWSDDGALIPGRTACGRATVVALNLNNLVSVTVRRNWTSAGWRPPRE
jgi:hypothetical protein